MATRKALDFLFTQRDLFWLDHLLPDESRRKKEDTKILLEQQQLEQVDTPLLSAFCLTGSIYRNYSRLVRIAQRHSKKPSETGRCVIFHAGCLLSCHLTNTMKILKKYERFYMRSFCFLYVQLLNRKT